MDELACHKDLIPEKTQTTPYRLITGGITESTYSET
jgi:hypothetical protein